MSSSDKQIILGEITGIYGVRGWVKVYSHTKPLENIIDYNPWSILLGGTWQDRKVVEAKRHGKGIVALIEGYHDRDQARELIGSQIATSRDNLPELEQDEYYWTDLVGLKVVHVDGTPMGEVDHLFSTGANDVVVVKGDKERLIPFVQGDVIKEINLDTGPMQVDWPLDV